MTVATTPLSPSLYQIAPSLGDGPIARAATRAVLAAERLGRSSWATHARACAVPFMFEGMERAFAGADDPRPAVAERLHRLAEFFESAAASGIALVAGPPADATGASLDGGDVARVTGEHYGRLFSGFSDRSFWDEPALLLRTRLERNGIDPSRFAGQVVLDAGCGGGRYTVAWRLLGAGSARGVDISATGIADARRRVDDAGIDGVSFEEGSVLELPVRDDYFDVVFSNGVLHHTEDWRRGIHELVRALRPGGLGWLYLIESPGGLFWDVIEVLRVITRDERRDDARAALRALGMPGNRVFYMLDHVMVPINVRLTPDEVEDALAEAGAIQVRRLARGADFDRVEAIHRDDPYAEVKYGVGENRYVFGKD